MINRLGQVTYLLTYNIHRRLTGGIIFHEGGDDFSRGSDVVLHAVVHWRRVRGASGMSFYHQLQHELVVGIIFHGVG